MAVSGSWDEDQQLGSTFDGRPHREPDPTIPAILYPPVELAGFRPRGRLHLDRWICIPAICFGALLHIGAAEIRI
jgi:hypothetical protein